MRISGARSPLRRVAYVCTDPGIPVFGSKGASVHVQATLRVLRRHGVEVHLLCPRTGGAAPTGLEDVVVHELPSVRAADPADRERAAQASDAAVGATLDGLTATGPLELIYERYALWGRTATAWASAHGVPSLLEVNAPLIQEQRTHRVLVDEAGATDVARSVLRAADGVCCVSDGVADWARSLAPGARITVVPNGVDTHQITAAREPVAGAAGTFTVGFVGTLKPWHGVEHLLDAVAMLRATPVGSGLRLLLVGDGPQAAALGEQSRRLGIADVVEWTGAVAPQEIAGLLRRMDLATAPYPATTDFYFSPLKLYEYLAAGLPVVASAVGAIPALLEHGRWGALVPPGDAEAIAAAIAALRADPALRARIHDSAPAAARRHDWEQVLASSLALVGAAAGAETEELTDVTL